MLSGKKLAVTETHLSYSKYAREFRRALLKREKSHEGAKSLLKSLFNEMDKDGDGIVTDSELRMFIKSVHSSHSIEDKDVESNTEKFTNILLQQIDINHDGTVSYNDLAEFLWPKHESTREVGIVLEVVRDALVNTIGHKLISAASNPECHANDCFALLEAFSKATGVHMLRGKLVEVHSLKRALHKLVGANALSDYEIEQLIHAMDANGDGVISPKEFREWLFLPPHATTPKGKDPPEKVWDSDNQMENEGRKTEVVTMTMQEMDQVDSEERFREIKEQLDMLEDNSDSDMSGHCLDVNLSYSDAEAEVDSDIAHPAVESPSRPVNRTESHDLSISGDLNASYAEEQDLEELKMYKWKDDSDTVQRLMKTLTQRNAEYRSLEMRFNHVKLQNDALVQQERQLRDDLSRLEFESAVAEENNMLLEEKLRTITSFEHKSQDGPGAESSSLQTLRGDLLSAASRRIAELENDMSSLRERTERREQQLEEEALNARSECEAYKEEAEGLTEQLAQRTVLYAAQERRFHSEQRAWSTRRDSQADEIIHLRARVQQLESQCSQLDRERINTIMELKESQAVLTDLREAYESDRSRLLESEQELSVALGMNQSLQDTVNRLRGADVEDIERDMAREVEEIRASAQRREEDLRVQLEEARELLQREGLRMNALADENSTLRRRVEEVEDLLRDIKDYSGFGISNDENRVNDTRVRDVNQSGVAVVSDISNTKSHTMNTSDDGIQIGSPIKANSSDYRENEQNQSVKVEKGYSLSSVFWKMKVNNSGEADTVSDISDVHSMSSPGRRVTNSRVDQYRHVPSSHSDHRDGETESRVHSLLLRDLIEIILHTHLTPTKTSFTDISRSRDTLSPLHKALTRYILGVKAPRYSSSRDYSTLESCDDFPLTDEENRAIERLLHAIRRFTADIPEAILSDARTRVSQSSGVDSWAVLRDRILSAYYPPEPHNSQCRSEHGVSEAFLIGDGENSCEEHTHDASLQSLRDQITSLQEALRSSENSIVELSDERDALVEELMQVRLNLSAAQSTREQASNRVNALETQVTLLQRDLEIAKKENGDVERLESKLKSAEDEVRAERELVANLQEENHKLADTVQTQLQEISTLEAEISKHTSTLNDVRCELESVKHSSQTIASEKSALVEEITGLKQHLESETSDLKLQLENMQSELNAALESREKYIEEQCAPLLTEVHDLKNEISPLRSELEAKVASLHEIELQYEKSQHRERKMSEEMDVLVDEVRRLSSAEKEFEKVRNERENLRAQLENIQMEHASKLDENAKHVAEEREVLVAELKKAKNVLVSMNVLKEERDYLSEKLKSTEDVCNEVSSRLEGVELEKSHLLHSIESLKRKLLSSTGSDSASPAGATKDNSVVWSNEKARLVSHIESLEAADKEKSEQIVLLETEKDEMSDKLRSFEELFAEASVKIEAAKDERARLLNKIERLDTCVMSLESERDSSECTIDESVISRLTQENCTLRDEIESLRAGCKDIDEKNDTLLAELNSLRYHNADLLAKQNQAEDGNSISNPRISQSRWEFDIQSAYSRLQELKSVHTHIICTVSALQIQLKEKDVSSDIATTKADSEALENQCPEHSEILAIDVSASHNDISDSCTYISSTEESLASLLTLVDAFRADLDVVVDMFESLTSTTSPHQDEWASNATKLGSEGLSPSSKFAPGAAKSIRALAKERDALETSLSLMQKEVNEMRSDLMRVNVERDRLQRIVEMTRLEKNASEEKVKELEEQVSELKDNVEALSSRNDALKECIKEIDVDRDDVISRHETEKQKIVNDMTAMIELVQDERDDLSQRLSAAEAKYEDSTLTVSNFRKREEELTSEIESLKEQLANCADSSTGEALSDVVKSLEARNEEVVAEFSALEQERDRMMDEIERLAMEYSKKVKTIEMEKGEIWNEVVQLEKKNKEAAGDIQILEKTNHSLSSKLEAVEMELVEMTSKYDECTVLINTLQDETTALTRQLRSGWTRQLEDDSASRIAQLQEELAVSKESILTIRRERDDALSKLEQKNSELESMNTQLMLLTKDKTELSTQLEAKNSETNAYVSEVEKLKSNISTLQAEKAAMKITCDHLSEDLEEVALERDSVQEQLLLLQENKPEKNQSGANAEDIHSLKKELENMKSKYTVALDSKSKYEVEIVRLQDESQRLRTRLDALNAEKRTLAQESVNTPSGWVKEKREYEELLSEKTSTIEVLKGELEGVTAHWRAEMSAAVEHVKRKSAEESTVMKERLTHSFHEEVSSLQSHISRLTSELEDQRSEFERNQMTSRTTLLDRENKITELQNKLLDAENCLREAENKHREKERALTEEIQSRYREEHNAEKRRLETSAKHALEERVQTVVAEYKIERDIMQRTILEKNQTIAEMTAEMKGYAQKLQDKWKEARRSLKEKYSKRVDDVKKHCDQEIRALVAMVKAECEDIFQEVEKASHQDSRFGEQGSQGFTYSHTSKSSPSQRYHDHSFNDHSSHSHSKYTFQPEKRETSTRSSVTSQRSGVVFQPEMLSPEETQDLLRSILNRSAVTSVSVHRSGADVGEVHVYPNHSPHRQGVNDSDDSLDHLSDLQREGRFSGGGRSTSVWGVAESISTESSRPPPPPDVRSPQSRTHHPPPTASESPTINSDNQRISRGRGKSSQSTESKNHSETFVSRSSEVATAIGRARMERMVEKLDAFVK